MPDLPRRRVLGGLVLTPLAFPGVAPANTPLATPPELQAHWPDGTSPRLQGQGRLRFLGLSIYDIRLWTPEGRPASAQDWAQRVLALEIVYRRALVGRLIAERSIKEMKRPGELSEDQSTRWLARMEALFPDVVDGDRLTGVHAPDTRSPARFFHNAKPLGDVDDPAFARRFFGIWLDEKTSEPALREQLLGPR